LENAAHFFNKNNQFIYNCVKVLEKGDYFGELGLLHHKPRAATVVAAVIYLNLIKSHFEINNVKKIGRLFLSEFNTN
jgi:hypothetical protein